MNFPGSKSLKKFLTGITLTTTLATSSPIFANNNPADEQSLETIIHNSEPWFQSEVLSSSSSYIDETASLLMNLMFPELPGTSQVMFMPYSLWGKSKVHDPSVQFKKYESAHMLLYTYDVDDYLVDRTLDLLEHEFKRNEHFFDFARFSEKFPFVLYNNRKDYQQSNFAPLGVLEGSGGMTSVDKKRRISIPYEQGETRFSSVVAHEFFHAYSITVASELQTLESNLYQTPPFPIWWIEGTAEYRSEGCHSEWEPVLRDLFLHESGFHMSILNEIGPTLLVYPLGCLMTEVAAENFGEQKIAEIYKHDELSFEKNIQKTLGITLDEWFSLADHALEERYGYLKQSINSLDEITEIAKESLLATYGERFLSLAVERGKLQLRLNQFDNREKTISTTLTESGTLAVERLFGDADLDASRVVYVAHNTLEQLVVQEYGFEDFDNKENNKEFFLGEKTKYLFPSFALISSPVFVDEKHIAFVGTENKYSDVYLFDLATQQLEKLTDDNLYEADLTVSSGILVFSREDDRNPNKPYTYNRHLYVLDLSSKKLEQLTFGIGIDTQPAFSPDGSKLLFVNNRGGSKSNGNDNDTSNIYLYDVAGKKAYQVTRAQTAAFNPHWINNKRILLNDLHQLAPRLLAYTLPKPAQLEKKSLELALNEITPSEKKEKEKLLQQIAEQSLTAEQSSALQQSSTSKPSSTWGEVDLTNGEANFTYAGESYRVTGIASSKNQIYLRAIPAHPQEIASEQTFFSFQEGKLTILSDRKKREKHELEKLLAENPKKAGLVRKYLWDNTIIDTLLSPDHRYVALLINYDLSLESESTIDGGVIKIIDLAEEKAEDFLALENIPAEGSIRLLANGKLVGFQATFQRTLPLLPFGSKGYMATIHSVKYSAQEDKNNLLEHHTPDKNTLEIDTLYGFIVDINNYVEGPVISSNGRFFAFVSEGEDSSTATLTRYDAVKEMVQHFTVDGSPDELLRFGFAGEGTYFIEGDTTITLHHLVGDSTEEMYLPLEGKFEEYSFENSVFSKDKVALVLKNRNTETQDEKLLIADFSTKKISEFGEQYIAFPAVRFLDDALLYQGRDRTGKEEWQIVGANASFHPLEKIRKVGNQLFFSNGKDLLQYDLNKGEMEEIVRDIAGFDLLGNFLFYSAYDEDEKRFAMKVKDIITGAKTTLPPASAFFPERKEDTLFYHTEQKNDLGFVIARVSNEEEITLTFIEQNPEQKSKPFLSSLRSITTPSLTLAYRNQPKTATLEREISPFPVAEQELSFQGAVGVGNGLFFFGQMQGYATDELHNNLLTFNLFANGGSFFSSNLTYINMPKDFGVNIYGQQYGDDFSSVGSAVSKFIAFSKFHRLSFIGGYEYQNSFFRDNNHVLQLGLAYGLDTAPIDYHGPYDGSRLFLQWKYGFSLSEIDDNNVDFSLDARHYLPFAEKVGLAFRTAAGTSQGPAPTQFILGGVDDIRGANLLSLYGQNYYFAGTEFRFPVADIAGLILPEPIRPASGLTAAWDVRGKLFGYFGDVFQNKDISKGLVDVPDFAVGPGLDFYYSNIRFTFTWNMYGKVDPSGGKADPGWWKTWNMFLMIPNW